LNFFATSRKEIVSSSLTQPLRNVKRETDRQLVLIESWSSMTHPVAQNSLFVGLMVSGFLPLISARMGAAGFGWSGALILAWPRRFAHVTPPFGLIDVQ
jgi:hypothetical protein